MSINDTDSIGVCGAGVMGSGIAQVAASRGHHVVVFDRVAAALDKGREGTAADLARQVARGRTTEQEAEDTLARIRWSRDVGDLAGCALVIEAIVEDRAAKTALFADVAAVVDARCILASNTSSLAIEDLARSVQAPERFAGLHFFNPVTAMKLVEVVPAAATLPEVVEALVDLMARWGKKPARVRDVPGFIVNRVARPYYAEAFAALGDGMTPEAIDMLLEAAGGFRMGPLTLTDMIGQDVNYAVASGVFDAYDGKTRFRPQPAQRALVDGARLGRKSGSGVYDYPAGRGQVDPIVPSGPIEAVAVASDPGRLAGFVEAMTQAGHEAFIDEALTPGTLRASGVLFAMGDGRTLADRGDGVDILIDHARDLAAATAIGVSGRNPAALAAAAALCDLIGKSVFAVPDRPGQIVLRTLAQLANAAADAVSDEVASAADIDMAMRFGANHPEGPLAWAARFGERDLGEVLVNIAAATGDAIYRPAPAFDMAIA